MYKSYLLMWIILKLVSLFSSIASVYSWSIEVKMAVKLIQNNNITHYLR